MENGIRDLAALAADDAEVERAINALPDAELLDLAGYAAEWDERRDAYSTDQQEEWANRRALALPSWFVPATVVLLTIIVLAWGA